MCKSYNVPNIVACRLKSSQKYKLTVDSGILSGSMSKSCAALKSRMHKEPSLPPVRATTSLRTQNQLLHTHHFRRATSPPPSSSWPANPVLGHWKRRILSPIFPLILHPRPHIVLLGPKHDLPAHVAQHTYGRGHSRHPIAQPTHHLSPLLIDLLRHPDLPPFSHLIPLYTAPPWSRLAFLKANSFSKTTPNKTSF